MIFLFLSLGWMHNIELLFKVRLIFLLFWTKAPVEVDGILLKPDIFLFFIYFFVCVAFCCWTIIFFMEFSMVLEVKVFLRDNFFFEILNLDLFLVILIGFLSQKVLWEISLLESYLYYKLRILLTIKFIFLGSICRWVVFFGAIFFLIFIYLNLNFLNIYAIFLKIKSSIY